MPDVGSFSDILMKLSVFIFAGAIHEFAHAVSAYRLGDSTARDEGRMTLNPLAHIDFIGTILFPVIGVGIGWMKPVPVYLGNLRHPLRDDAIISFAGPFSNFVQACIAVLLLQLIPFPGGLIKTIIVHYAYINILLMGFNLLPMPPLDGGAILKFFLPPRLHDSYDRFAVYSGFILLGLIFLPAIIGIPNIILYWLSPFGKLLSFIVSLPLYLVILINIINLGIIAYFFRRNIFFIKNKLEQKKHDHDMVKQHDTKISKNYKYISLAEKIIPDINNGLSLNEKDKHKLIEIQTLLDLNANLCPKEDYNIYDETCRHCEWFANCLIRETSSGNLLPDNFHKNTNKDI